MYIHPEMQDEVNRRLHARAQQQRRLKLAERSKAREARQYRRAANARTRWMAVRLTIWIALVPAIIACLFGAPIIAAAIVVGVYLWLRGWFYAILFVLAAILPILLIAAIIYFAGPSL